MPSIACMARPAPALSGPPIYFGKSVGTICHDTP